MGQIVSHEHQFGTLMGAVEELGEVEEELEPEVVQDNGLKERNQQLRSDCRQHVEDFRQLLDEAKERTPSELNTFISRAQDAATRIGLRGEAAQHVPLAQIRVVSPWKSSCHNATKVLAQYSSGGFVLGFCSHCGRGETVKAGEFDALDLWVTCPKGHGRMKSTLVGHNYGFSCEKCRWEAPFGNSVTDSA